jgi:hypothetical protein
MIRKRVQRFSEKIMRKQEAEARYGALAAGCQDTDNGGCAARSSPLLASFAAGQNRSVANPSYVAYTSSSAPVSSKKSELVA